MRRREGPRYVYFAVAGGMVKIGCSCQPVERLTQIGEWIPFQITLAATMPGDFAVETALHNMFADEWSHLEWFRASARIMAFIGRVAAGLPVVITDNPDAVRSAKRLAVKAKKNLTRLVRAAEIARHGRLLYPELVALRPAWAQSAMDSYTGAHVLQPSAEAEETLARYIAELATPNAGSAA